MPALTLSGRLRVKASRFLAQRETRKQRNSLALSVSMTANGEVEGPPRSAQSSDSRSRTPPTIVSGHDPPTEPGRRNTRGRGATRAFPQIEPYELSASTGQC